MDEVRVRRVLAVRMDAMARGDLAVVRECDTQLARWGIDPIPPGAPEHSIPPPGEKRPKPRKSA